jgi:indole-3-glycerol phosphate synthase
MKTILDEIVAAKQQELKETEQVCPLTDLEKMLPGLPPVRDFGAALRGGHDRTITIIAEVKKASPSKGIICEQFHPVEIACQYQENGAAALSVLTEERYFLGSLDYMQQIKEATAIPVLRKDFIFDPYQLYEARVRGADAVLLIAALLERGQLSDLMALCTRLSLSYLLEVHNERELETALGLDAYIIGINNRDLNTFTTDIRTSLRLGRLIPRGKIIVSESGIGCREDIIKLQDAGVDAFLIGEMFMKENKPGNKLRELMGKSVNR